LLTNQSENNDERNKRRNNSPQRTYSTFSFPLPIVLLIVIVFVIATVILNILVVILNILVVILNILVVILALDVSLGLALPLVFMLSSMVIKITWDLSLSHHLVLCPAFFLPTS